MKTSWNKSECWREREEGLKAEEMKGSQRDGREKKGAGEDLLEEKGELEGTARRTKWKRKRKRKAVEGKEKKRRVWLKTGWKKRESWKERQRLKEMKGS